MYSVDKKHDIFDELLKSIFNTVRILKLFIAGGLF